MVIFTPYRRTNSTIVFNFTICPTFNFEMDEHVVKRADGGQSFSMRPGIVFKDQNNEDRSIQCRDRLGCGTRHNTVRGAQIDTQEKSKYARASFHAMNGKVIAGSSSKSSSTSRGYGRSFREQPNQKILRGSAVAETSSKQDEIDKLTNIECLKDLNSDDSRRGKEHLEYTATVIGPLETEDTTESTISDSVWKPHRQINGNFGSGKQDPSSRSFMRCPNMAYTHASHPAKPVAQRLSSGAEGCGLNRLNCTSTSDVLSSGASSSGFTHHGRVDTVRKRPSEGESSTSRCKGAGASSTERYVVSMHTGSGSSSSSMSKVTRQPVSRRTRNQPTTGDGSVSVGTGRASTGESQRRLSAQADYNILPLDETIMLPQYQRNHFSLAEVPPGRSYELRKACDDLDERPGSSSQTFQSRSMSQPEDNSTQMLFGSSGDGYHHFNVEGIAEALLALEHIEQDEELTYEQLSVLETSLFFCGLSFHDQHRALRMDIENMSYEELLALEEKMGTVSTALSEEQLSKCLKRNLYEPTYQATGIAVCGDENMKCSICQEEFIREQEVGELQCEHLYHATCIEQWLRRKNWCPICKSSALPL
ncbi:uncharacterized protein LOC135581673 isoform X1 [Musa acuminata AAA Group]|uniref:uncharacterized protein LOC135581673 isoform X1 n=2 Tax=Musa acuminata AAA Group TaxID=214697 RepID=UPI0031D01621